MLKLGEDYERLKRLMSTTSSYRKISSYLHVQSIFQFSRSLPSLLLGALTTSWSDSSPDVSTGYESGASIHTVLETFGDKFL